MTKLAENVIIRGGGAIMSRFFSFMCVAAIASSAYATSGTWQTREGVGTGGTNWATYEDPDNWAGGVVPDNGKATLPSSAVYVNSTNGLALSAIHSSASAVSSYSVIRSDKTVALTRVDANLLQKVYLYSDWTWNCSSTYAGLAQGVQICGDCKGFAGYLLCQDNVRYRFDLYANAAGETRTYSQMFGGSGSPDARMNGYSTLTLVGPRGSDEDIVGTWSQTEGSPFLSRVGDEHALCVGTTVTGDGIPDGTFLKRAFPDGTIELSAAATNTIAANSLTFAAFAPNFSANMYRIFPYNSVGVVTIRAQKHRAKDKARFTSYIQPSSVKLAAVGIKIGVESGFVPATLALGSNSGYATKYELENCELEFTGSGKVTAADFYYCSFTIPNSAHTATLVVGAGKSSSIGIITNRIGTVVKKGAGRLSIGLPDDARAKCTGAIVVEEGTLEIRGNTVGDNYIPSLTVRSGARVYIPAGVVLTVGSITVEEGSVFGGYGRLACTGLSDAALLGLVLEDGVSIDDGRSGDAFSIEMLRGRPNVAAQDGDGIWVFDTNALLRVNGTGVFDVLVVGGGGGGGSKCGGGGGGGGVVYTQQMVVASGVYQLAVGLGGKGAPDKNTVNTSGGDSCMFGLVAYGGGAGGTYNGRGNNSCYGIDGASGGGGGIRYPYSDAGKAQGGAGVEGQGYEGGRGFNTNATNNAYLYCTGGGGGGAGGPGESAGIAVVDGDTKVVGGNGGPGRLCEIYGSKYYGGGGGGGTTSKRVSGNFQGGIGGGGDGGVTASTTVKPGANGTDGLGGGGGGGSCYTADSEGGAGGDGGKGVVILRWRQPAPAEKDLPDDDLAVGGTVRHRHGYAIHKFLDGGSFVLSEPTIVDMLIVGGGGGGSRSGGGGGGGGVIVVSNAYLLAGSYAITVGVGGTGAATAGAKPTGGTDSVFSFGGNGAYDLRAVGGGGGGSSDGGRKGGSGGGGGAPYVIWSNLTLSGGAGTDGQGHAGGTGVHTYSGDSSSWRTCQAGGGGGAGAPGGDATTSVPGNGGDGIMCDFVGKPEYYGGGGGGGSATYSSAAPTYYRAIGGLGGGGRGGSAYEPYPHASNGEHGTDGLGGGGGGAGGACDATGVGGHGGRGVVVIRYRVRQKGATLIVK